MIHRFYLEPILSYGDTVAHLRNAAKFTDYITCDRRMVDSTKGHSETLGESIDCHQASQRVGPIRQHLHLRTYAFLKRIELVLHLSDNLFQNVFQGDDTSRPSVFVDDDGEMRLFVLHLGHQLRDRRCLWHSQNWSEDGLDGKQFTQPPPAQLNKHVFDVDQANNIVQRSLVHGEARIVLLGDFLP